MKVLDFKSDFPKNVVLVLGFFDGFHLGHRNLLELVPSGCKKVLVTFSKSPAEYFLEKFNYIYPRNITYSIAEKLGVDYLLEYDFSEIMGLSADEYLKKLVDKFEPKYIVSGFNHTFGKNKSGDSEFLKKKQEDHGYIYICAPEFKIDDETVSSTNIKKFLSKGDLKKASLFLGENFRLESKVINGVQLGRKLGFPTANMEYPESIVRIPYGVYFARAFNHPAVLNWGIKPSLNGKNELLELHILDFSENLYGKNLEIEILDKIRDEQNFGSLEELKEQIKKDIQLCLKLSL
jgi:riboflavin kinase/FMN adenylyltransferase